MTSSSFLSQMLVLASQPQQVQDLPELWEVCLQEHCVLLHTSDKRLCLMCFVQTIEFQNAQMNE